MSLDRSWHQSQARSSFPGSMMEFVGGVAVLWQRITGERKEKEEKKEKARRAATGSQKTKDPSRTVRLALSLSVD